MQIELKLIDHDYCPFYKMHAYVYQELKTSKYYKNWFSDGYNKKIVTRFNKDKNRVFEFSENDVEKFSIIGKFNTGDKVKHNERILKGSKCYTNLVDDIIIEKYYDSCFKTFAYKLARNWESVYLEHELNPKIMEV